MFQKINKKCMFITEYNKMKQSYIPISNKAKQQLH